MQGDESVVGELGYLFCAPYETKLCCELRMLLFSARLYFGFKEQVNLLFTQMNSSTN
jgi:hypothetical protein